MRESRFRPHRRRIVSTTPLSTFVLIAVAVALPAAASFPPISEDQKALESVPGSPDAEAVVLAARAELWMMDLRNQRPTSTLQVWRRLKVLTPGGAETYGEVTIPHSRQLRLSNFSGRTVLPDGREIPVGEDAVFRRQVSRAEREFVTAVAFPSVEPGAILEYQYEVRFDSIFFLEPWFFQSEIPTLLNEVIYHVPQTLEVTAWGQAPPGRQIQQEVHSEKDGRRVRLWMENLPAVPDEPWSFPLEDLSARFMLIPRTYYGVGGSTVPLLSSWKDVCNLIDEVMYREVGPKSRAVKSKSQELAAGADGPRAVAEAIFQFVRDQILTVPGYGVYVAEGSSLGRVLSEGRGSAAEKALLLHGMLQAAKIDASLVWVPDRWEGRIDLEVPNPHWFDTILVRVRIPNAGGEELAYLDPSAPRLGFGYLRPPHEGMPALVFDPKNPELISIPETPYSRNRRQAVLHLTVDGEGRLSGRGELELSGHHAWARLLREDTAEATTEAWRQWLKEHLSAYEVDEVVVEESVANRLVRVQWTQRQRDEEVLGDELSVQLSQPLGPARQPFQLAPERRHTPVLLAFGDVDEVQVHLSWPEGWQVEAAPKNLERRTSVGSATATLELDGEARELTYDRRIELTQRELTNAGGYQALRSLYDTLEKHDAQSLVLVAP